MSFEINLLHTFMTVVGCRNLTHAAEIIGIEQPAVSKQIKKLQEQLGVELIVPHQSGLVLTPEGEYLARIAPSMLEGVDRLPIDLKAIKNKPEGELKVIVENFGRDLVNEYFNEFSELYPGIKLNIRTEESRQLLFSGQLSGAFVGVTSIQRPDDSQYIWKRLGTGGFYPYGHPKYFEKFGIPINFEELDDHRIVRYIWNKSFTSYKDDRKNNPLLYLGRPEKSPRGHFITTDDTVHCRSLLLKGAGIATLPMYQARNTGLVRLFNDKYDPSICLQTNTWLVYPRYAINLLYVKIFKEFIEEKIKEDVNKTWLYTSI